MEILGQSQDRVEFFQWECEWPGPALGIKNLEMELRECFSCAPPSTAIASTGSED